VLHCGGVGRLESDRQHVTNEGTVDGEGQGVCKTEDLGWREPVTRTKSKQGVSAKESEERES